MYNVITETAGEWPNHLPPNLKQDEMIVRTDEDQDCFSVGNRQTAQPAASECRPASTFSALLFKLCPAIKV